jgi:hypothetical protein
MVGSEVVGDKSASRLAWLIYAAFVISIATLVIAVVVWREVRDVRDDTDRLLCLQRATYSLPAPAPADEYLRVVSDCLR